MQQSQTSTLELKLFYKESKLYLVLGLKYVNLNFYLFRSREKGSQTFKGHCVLQVKPLSFLLSGIFSDLF